jgi:inosine-uridine nucleoside N-ribohydrolase
MKKLCNEGKNRADELAGTGQKKSENLCVLRFGRTGLMGRLAVAVMALLATTSFILADEPAKLVVFDNDFYGPATTNLQAAALLLTNPGVKVLGLTVVSGDGWRDEEIAHTLRLLEILRREDVPVVPGATFPLVNTQVKQQAWEKSFGMIPWKGAWNTKDGLFPNYKSHGPFEIPTLEEGPPTLKPSGEIAAEFLIRQVREHPHQVTILAGGPMTNLAMAIRLDPEFPSLAKELIFMGGYIGAGLSKATGNPDFVSDFNFIFDPEAAEIVVTAAWPKITSVADVTNDPALLFSDDIVQQIGQVKTPLSEYVTKYAEKSVPLWDELTTGILLDPTLVTKQKEVLMDVDISHGPGYGSARVFADSVAPHLGERKVNVIVDVDSKRFIEMFVKAMQRQPAQ